MPRFRRIPFENVAARNCGNVPGVVNMHVRNLKHWPPHVNGEGWHSTGSLDPFHHNIYGGSHR